MKGNMKKLLEYYPLQFITAVESHGSVWFSASEYNSLFCMDCDSGEVEYKGMFPQEKADAVNLHSYILSYNNTLYFIPWHSQNIIEYEIETDNYRIYEICGFNIQPPYFGAVQWDNYIYFWQATELGVLRFNIVDKSIEKVNRKVENEISSELERENYLWEKWEENYSWQSYAKAENCIYVVSVSTNRILKIDMKENEHEYYFIEKSNGITSICSIDDYFILTDINDFIIYWRPDKGVFKSEQPKDISIGNARYCEKSKNKIYYSLLDEKRILCFDILTKSFHYIGEPEVKDTYEYWGAKHREINNNLFRISEEVWGIDRYTSSLWRICDNKKKILDLVLCKGRDRFIMDRAKGDEKAVWQREEGIFLLEQYVDLINILRVDNMNQNKCGRDIYEEIMYSEK